MFTFASLLKAFPISFLLGVAATTVTTLGSGKVSKAVKSCLLFSECAYDQRIEMRLTLDKVCIMPC